MIFNFAAWQVTFLMIDFSYGNHLVAIQLIGWSQHLAMAATRGAVALVCVNYSYPR